MSKIIQIEVPNSQADQELTQDVKIERNGGSSEERWLRAMADLDNLKKRQARRLEAERRRHREELLREFLPVVDNLERALQAPPRGDAAWREGVQATHRQILDIIERQGAEPFESLGATFDPTRHEAIGRIDRSDQAEGTIVEVAQVGYQMEGDRILRPARVIVAGPNANEMRRE